MIAAVSDCLPSGRKVAIASAAAGRACWAGRACCAACQHYPATTAAPGPGRAAQVYLFTPLQNLSTVGRHDLSELELSLRPAVHGGRAGFTGLAGITLVALITMVALVALDGKALCARVTLVALITLVAGVAFVAGVTLVALISFVTLVAFEAIDACFTKDAARALVALVANEPLQPTVTSITFIAPITFVALEATGWRGETDSGLRLKRALK